MAAKTQRLGLTWAIFGTFTIALMVFVLVLFLVVPSQAEQYLTETLRARGMAVARDLERRVSISDAPAGAEALREIDRVVGDEPEIRGAWAISCRDAECADPTVVASRVHFGKERNPAAEAKFTKAMVEQFTPKRKEQSLLLETGELLVIDQVPSAPDRGDAYVLVALDRTRIDDGVSSLRSTLFIALILSVAVFLALLALLSRVLIIRPISAMRAMAARLSEADLSGRVEGAATRELDELADSLNNIGQGLRDTLGRVRGVSEGVAQVIDQISQTAATTSNGATTVATRVEETSSAMVEMLASLKGIAENVEVLFQSAEESSSSILEMSTTNDEVADNVTKMSASVEQTTSAIEEMTYSIKEVARNLLDLLKNAELTSSAIHEMNGAIGQVETNAYETARLSEQVSKDAESGMESIQKTIVGIDRIKDSSRGASTVIEQLGKRIGEIGNIVDVIDDVAEQTNLLALNAAIIAAQAGEHGKGFAVVAEEIKDLAERTGTSTREIADLIQSVQSEARNAVSAMNQGVRSVDEGVLLGREAEAALKKIQESSGRSTQMVKAIARASVEQSRSSKDVTAAAEKIRETVEQISRATTEQARGSEQIVKSAEHMKKLTQHVNNSAKEQSHGGKQISRSIENINEMVTHLNRAQKEQTRGSEQVLKAIETIKSVAEAQSRSAKQLEEAIETLRVQSDVLRGEIRRFRV